MIDLAPQHLAIVREILSRHAPGLEVRAFGSRISGKAKSYSDLDIAIVGIDKTEAAQLAALREALAESELPFRVDVLDWHRISDGFREIIARQYDVIQNVTEAECGGNS